MSSASGGLLRTLCTQLGTSVPRPPGAMAPNENFWHCHGRILVMNARSNRPQWSVIPPWSYGQLKVIYWGKWTCLLGKYSNGIQSEHTVQKNFELIDGHCEANTFHCFCVWVSDAKLQLNKRPTNVLDKHHQSTTGTCCVHLTCKLRCTIWLGWG